MKDFKKLTMYDENIEITASDSTTPLLCLDNNKIVNKLFLKNGFKNFKNLNLKNEQKRTFKK